MMEGRKRQQTGFTLLEAIVALTIFSMTALTLFSWLSSNTYALQRVEERQNALMDMRSAIALVETINPMQEPEGERPLGAMTVRWQSMPLVERRAGRGPDGGLSVFDLTLVEMRVEIWRREQLIDQFSVTRAGWEVSRPALEETL